MKELTNTSNLLSLNFGELRGINNLVTVIEKFFESKKIKNRKVSLQHEL